MVKVVNAGFGQVIDGILQTFDDRGRRIHLCRTQLAEDLLAWTAAGEGQAVVVNGKVIARIDLKTGDVLAQYFNSPSESKQYYNAAISWLPLNKMVAVIIEKGSSRCFRGSEMW